MESEILLGQGQQVQFFDRCPKRKLFKSTRRCPKADKKQCKRKRGPGGGVY